MFWTGEYGGDKETYEASEEAGEDAIAAKQSDQEKGQRVKTSSTVEESVEE